MKKTRPKFCFKVNKILKANLHEKINENFSFCIKF